MSVKCAEKNSRQLRLWLMLGLVLLVIFFWRSTESYKKPQITKLSAAPLHISGKLLEASDRAFGYRLLLFWLQQFDVQSGQYISYRDLDYQNLISWLEFLSKMEPQSQYPMLLASRIYSRVADQYRVKAILDYIYIKFQQDPDKNWRWLAEATVIARHTLKDRALSLKYASALALSGSSQIPYWARDMRLIILEDMGETEQVKLLVGGLIAGKTVTDRNEIRFLELLLQRLQNKDN